MHPSNPPADCGTDSQHDTVGRHGDVDRNGDLIDQAELERDQRLMHAIVPAWPALFEAQLAGVRRLLHIAESDRV